MTLTDELVPETPARRRPLGLLLAATAANYLWQVPYAIHQYGWNWAGLPKLSVALLLSGVWFAVAAFRYIRGRTFGRAMLIVFLLAEAGFYLVHNLSGAFLADLPHTNPVVLVASILGYANMLLALAYLWLLRRP